MKNPNKKTYVCPKAHPVEFVSDVFMKYWSVPVYEDPINPGEEDDIGVKMEFDKKRDKRNLWEDTW